VYLDKHRHMFVLLHKGVFWYTNETFLNGVFINKFGLLLFSPIIKNFFSSAEIPCDGGQVYQVCPNECTRTCFNIANFPDCVQSSVCAEGCGCPAGQTLDDTGNCVGISSCPCIFDGKTFQPGLAVERGNDIW